MICLRTHEESVAGQGLQPWICHLKDHCGEMLEKMLGQLTCIYY